MNKRDLKADLELIESMNKHFVEESGDFVRDVVFPHALRRAIAAEEELERMKEQRTEALATLRVIEYYDFHPEATIRAKQAIQRIQEGKGHE